jgi:predicted nucleotidyltransferase
VKNYYNNAVFPTELHQQTAELVKDFFAAHPLVDTFLVVNSCARGQANPESDLDFAVLLHPEVSPAETLLIEQEWQYFAKTNADILHYKESYHFAQIHLDVIDGKYLAATWDDGGGPDFFEVEIGNRIAYSAPLGKEGSYFIQLKKHWLPYYDEQLRLQRLSMAIAACEYDLDHIPFFIRRELYFQAFDRLYKAFQEFLQALFIAYKTYPIAYNKWIKEEITVLLNLPELYDQLPAIISVNNIISTECNEKAAALRRLLEAYCKS